MRALSDLFSDTVQRSLIILKYVNQVPSFASCSKCQRKFFTPPCHRSDPTGARDYLEQKFWSHKCDVPSVTDGTKKAEMTFQMPKSEKSDGLALTGVVWQTSSMKTSPNYSRRHEDRKAQKLLERIDKKLQEKGTTQNSLQAASPKQRPSAA
ncbi:MAG TPA: hypothetical protein VJX69_03935 [Terriglobales bacterium]|nr:hypothetical protein [Terriglobales bacterium]